MTPHTVCTVPVSLSLVPVRAAGFAVCQSCQSQAHRETVSSHTHNLGFHLFVPEVKPRSLCPESVKETENRWSHSLNQSECSFSQTYICTAVCTTVDSNFLSFLQVIWLKVWGFSLCFTVVEYLAGELDNSSVASSVFICICSGVSFMYLPPGSGGLVVSEKRPS